ncbi:DUF427 domain-containing protein [Paenibacillus sp. NPDC058071]|uniref:DUF427 domain-containing protein n=1 Tax=Paenibacillus sp. NPDC058071 TaxID=3346326 RepID=UPI0036DCBBF7
MSETVQSACQTEVSACSGEPGVPAVETRVKTEPSQKWVRVEVDGVTIADSKSVVLLHERGHLPVYYFPKSDVRQDLIAASEHRTYCPYKGYASYWDIKVGDRVIEQAAWSYEDPIPQSEGVREYIAFYWNKVDKWLEEEEEVFVHPRDPYKRVDVIASSRHIQIVLNGEVVADSKRPVIVFETGVPVRYYLPEEDIRKELFISSDLKTRCPYKGEASYLTADINGQRFENIVWSYPNPIQEIPKIAGLHSFYNEKVDAVYVDGVQETVQQWHKSVIDVLNLFGE